MLEEASRRSFQQGTRRVAPPSLDLLRGKEASTDFLLVEVGEDPTGLLLWWTNLSIERTLGDGERSRTVVVRKARRSGRGCRRGRGRRSLLFFGDDDDDEIRGEVLPERGEKGGGGLRGGLVGGDGGKRLERELLL